MSATKDYTDIQEVVDWLIDQFPKAFFRIGSHVKPLKLGILDDILSFYFKLDVAPFSRKKLRSGLNYYTSTKAYLNAQKEGAKRVNLFGYAEDVVSLDQANYALERVQVRRERVREK